MLAPEPLFVNRVAELAEFDAVLAQLGRGRRRHLALLGLRRIGKTMLLDAVRRRHPTFPIAYLALDEVVSTPEDFARALVMEVLRAAAAGAGRVRPVVDTDEALSTTARELSPRILPSLERILPLSETPATIGALLTAVLRFPAAVSEALDLPILLMLDEFQDIVRLRAFPGADNLLGTIRAALDRPGKVAFVAAGSRISAMRKLLSDGESPLFTRFEQLELRPFVPEATHELASRIWDEDELTPEPDASVRLHRLTGGWPFYVHAVAARAAQHARGGDGLLTPDLVDLAFKEELVGRAAPLGQQCRYLLDTALQTDAADLRNVVEAVLRRVARWQPISRAQLARHLGRHHAPAQVYRAANRLVDTDFLQEEAGQLTLLDPVFRLWLLLEPARRDPEALLGNPQALRRLLAWYEAQHAEDRARMGVLFERRVENVVRQFRGQMVEGYLFGVPEPVQLPVVRDVVRLQIDDPDGRYAARPDSYEIDLVALAERSEDTWIVEAKHRRGAITRAMLERFLACAQVAAAARNLSVGRLWVVAPRGIRPDALALARANAVSVSGLRQLDRLERLLARSSAFTLSPG